MALKDLKINQGNVDVVVEVVAKDEPRSFTKFGRTGKVCTATVKDDSGEMKLSLWNDDVDKVKVGDKIHIINGYVNEWQGEPQLTTGRFGSKEVVERSGESALDEATEDEKAEEEALNEEKSDEGEHILTEDEKNEEEVLEGEAEITDEGEQILTEDEKEEEAALYEENKPEESIEESEDSDERPEEKLFEAVEEEIVDNNHSEESDEKKE